MSGGRNPNSNEQDDQADKFPLDALPLDLLKDKTGSIGKTDTNIGQYLSPLDKKHLAEIGNIYLLSIFKSDIKPANDLIKQFLTHIVRGEEAEAKAMLERDPCLVLEVATVTDYSGRKIRGTALQLALGADDDAMIEMLLPYFKKLPNGEKEWEKQWNEQFPESSSKQEEVPYDFNPLVEAINSKNQEKINQALTHLRAYLKPKGVIKSGKHFDVHMLINAYEVHNKHYDNWDGNQRRISWSQMIGYIQRYLPACYAQAYCQGLYGVSVLNQPLKRSMKLENTVFFPLDTEPTFRLGSDFGVYSVCVQRGYAPRWHGGDGVILKNYVEQKQQRLASLRKPFDRELHQRNIHHA